MRITCRRYLAAAQSPVSRSLVIVIIVIEDNIWWENGEGVKNLFSFTETT